MLHENRRPTVFLASVLMLSFAFGLTGCGGGSVDGKYPVSGTVTLDGAPLAQGAIEFTPTDPTVSSRSGSIIRDGSFQLPAEHGLEPGSYKVMITASSGGAVVEEGPPGDSAEVPPAEELIPARYNTETELTADVSAGGENTFEFPLESN